LFERPLETVTLTVSPWNKSQRGTKVGMAEKSWTNPVGNDRRAGERSINKQNIPRYAIERGSGVDKFKIILYSVSVHILSIPARQLVKGDHKPPV
jgi:hypothetical protein